MAHVCCIKDDNGPMSLDCFGSDSPGVSKKGDDGTYLGVSSESSNDDGDDTVSASVVGAVNDLVTGRLVQELGAVGSDIVRSASEVLLGRCQPLDEIEFDDAYSEASSYSTDFEEADASDFVPCRSVPLPPARAIRRSWSFARSNSTGTRSKKESHGDDVQELETLVAQRAEAYANALAALEQKQAEALDEHHRLVQKERSVGASLSPRKPSVAEQVLQEAVSFAADASFAASTPSDEGTPANPITLANETTPEPETEYPEPIIKHKIYPLPKTQPNDDASSTVALPSDFVPFWQEVVAPSPSEIPEDPTPAWVTKREEENMRKERRSKIIPKFLRKKTKYYSGL